MRLDRHARSPSQGGGTGSNPVGAAGNTQARAISASGGPPFTLDCHSRANPHGGWSMRGFIRPRGDAWELRVYLGQDVITGKKRYACHTVRGSRREAERVLAKMVGDADRGGFARTGATTGELLERWLAHAKADFSPKTVRETRGYMDRDLFPALGDVALDKLRTEDLDRYYRSLLAHGSRGRPLSPVRSGGSTAFCVGRFSRRSVGAGCSEPRRGRLAASGAPTGDEAANAERARAPAESR